MDKLVGMVYNGYNKTKEADMEYFYNWLWQVYHYGQTTFEYMTSNEQLKLMQEFIKDCE